MERVIKTESLVKGNFLEVQRETIVHESGNQATREFIVHGGGAVILAKDTKESVDKFLLIKQYRAPFHRDFFEFPAGRRDGSEDFLTTAQRELREETGFTSTHWQKLGVTHPAIGYSNEVIHIFLSENLVAGAHSREEGEHIEMFWKSEIEINAMISEGSITDAKTLSVWMLYQVY